MNILFIKHFFIGFMGSEIPKVSVFGHYPYSVNLPYNIKFSGNKYIFIHSLISIYNIIMLR